MRVADVKGKVDFGILTIREDEFEAVLQRFPRYATVSDGRRPYNLRIVETGASRPYIVAVIRSVEQGNADAQGAARDLLDDLEPQWLLVVGIGGGVPSDDFTLGDVVVSIRICDFRVDAVLQDLSPEFALGGGPIHRAAATFAANLPARKSEIAGWSDRGSIGVDRPAVELKDTNFYGGLKWKKKVRKSLKHHFVGRRDPLAVAGAIASSDRLIKDTELLGIWLKMARQVIAVEMEAAGAYHTTRNHHREVPMLAIRGISDIVGFRRDPRWTNYACHSAAAFARALLQLRPIEPRGELVDATNIVRGTTAAGQHEPPPFPPKTSQSARVELTQWSDGTQRLPITIALRRVGEKLERAYHLPGSDECFPSSRAFSAVGDGYRAIGKHGLAALHSVLARGDSENIASNLTGEPRDRAGAALFEALFGEDEGHLGAILRTAFRKKDNLNLRPIDYPARVRVITDDALLRGLPWRAATWDKRLLIDFGWTFEVASALTPARPADHVRPGPVLVILPGPAPASSGSPVHSDTESHLTALLELFENISPGFTKSSVFRVARTLREADLALRELRPSVVYYHGVGDLQGTELQLHLDEPRLLRDFVRIFAGRPPSVLFFNGSLSAQGGWSAAEQLFQEIPLVFVNATAAWAGASREFALRWLRSWFTEDVDPVMAAHVLPPGANTRRMDWATPLVYANYDAWPAASPQARAAPTLDRPEDWFDRDTQRAQMSKHVVDLTQHTTQRVEAAVAFGEPGNAGANIAQQIIDYITQRDGLRLNIRRIPVTFPSQPGRLLTLDSFEHALATNLRECLRIRSGTNLRSGQATTLAEAIRAVAPKWRNEARGIVWLDWGVLRDKQSYQTEVHTWLDFVRDRLSAIDVNELRVVAFLALETLPGTLAGITEWLDGLVQEGDHATMQLGFSSLPMLDKGKLADIRRYLGTQRDVVCEPRILEELARAIFAATDGRYEETTAMLREGFAMRSWHALLARLRKGPLPRMP